MKRLLIVLAFMGGVTQVLPDGGGGYSVYPPNGGMIRVLPNGGGGYSIYPPVGETLRGEKEMGQEQEWLPNEATKQADKIQRGAESGQNNQ